MIFLSVAGCHKLNGLLLSWWKDSGIQTYVRSINSAYFDHRRLTIECLR